ncbi:MAG TPA: helix-turn-helix domain-containing protein [Actinomadura sp.]|nr:helix-turn-helix domain-containing protein [Actinomadura sp.]
MAVSRAGHRGRDATIASIARLLGVSRSTLYKYLLELKQGRRPCGHATATG